MTSVWLAAADSAEPIHLVPMMDQLRYQVIFFDAAGTLFHVRGSVAEIYLDHAVRHGFKQSEESLFRIKSAFARAFRDAPPPVFAATEPAALKECERLWWFDVVHNVFYRVGMFERFDEFFDEVFEAFGKPDAWQLYPETLGVLKQLKARGCELGIISNFDSRLFPILRGLGLADFFDTVTISSLVQAAKPSARIFRQALEKHAVDPADAVHVGDSLEEDARGARDAGLAAVLLARDETPAQGDIPVIVRLDGLYPLVSQR